MASARKSSLRLQVLEVRPSHLPSPSPSPSPSSSSAPPSPRKEVRFASSDDELVSGVTRPLSPAEAWSLFHFETHARQCSQCYDPYAVYRRGHHLCEEGTALGRDVACHLRYSRADGQIYSSGTGAAKPVRVELLPNYTQVRPLLRAMAKGLLKSVLVPAPATTTNTAPPTPTSLRPLRRATTTPVASASPKSKSPPRSSPSTHDATAAPLTLPHISFAPASPVREEHSHSHSHSHSYTHSHDYFDSRPEIGLVEAGRCSSARTARASAVPYRTEIRTPERINTNTTPPPPPSALKRSATSPVNVPPRPRPLSMAPLTPLASARTARRQSVHWFVQT